MGDFLKAIFAVIGFILVVTLFTAIPVWLLWNWLMPIIFGLPKLTILQAFGINLLCHCLFQSSNNKEN